MVEGARAEGTTIATEIALDRRAGVAVVGITVAAAATMTGVDGRATTTALPEEGQAAPRLTRYAHHSAPSPGPNTLRQAYVACVRAPCAGERLAVRRIWRGHPVSLDVACVCAYLLLLLLFLHHPAAVPSALQHPVHRSSPGRPCPPGSRSHPLLDLVSLCWAYAVYTTTPPPPPPRGQGLLTGSVFVPALWP